MKDTNRLGAAPRPPFAAPPTPPPPPTYVPPIASPHGKPGQGPYMPNVRISRDYSDAPKIVKSARLLAMLSVIGGAIVAMAPFALKLDSRSMTLGLIQGVVYIGMGVWLSCGHYSGQKAAWVGQIVLSAFGLLRIPVGTAIHGYLLSQWFSDEVKDWYGQ